MTPPALSRWAARSAIASDPVPAGSRAGSRPRAVERFVRAWRGAGVPSLRRHWRAAGAGATPELLAELVRVDLRARFDRGLRPTVGSYLAEFPDLATGRDRVVSLIYEEFCLLEEAGEPPEPGQFCARYPAWRDSLAVQLDCHALLSLAALGAPTPASVRWPEPGEWFTAEFRLTAVLGRGGCGRVYLADQPEFGRQVVLKVMPDEGREHAIQGRLDHDHIVPVWSVVRDAATGLRGQCMPYRPGLPLDQVADRLDPRGATRTARALLEQVVPPDRLAPGRPLPPGWAGFPLRGRHADAVAWIGLILARALGHAHAHGIFHRDVKPANVLLSIEDGPLLLDFNLAHDPDPAQAAATARSGGTLPYMAPEQLAAFLEPDRWADVGAAADLYALGLVLQELLTSQPPEPPDPTASQGRAIRELLAIRRQPPTPARSQNRRVPRTLEAIVSRCLCPEPADRYPDAAALADDLQRYLDRRPLRHARVLALRERLAHFVSRHRVRLTMVTLGVAVALAGTGLVLRTPQFSRRFVLNTLGPRVTAQSLIRSAEAAYHLKDFATARSELEQALQIEPDSYEALHLLGSVHNNGTEDYERAYQLFNQALAALPPPPLPRNGDLADHDRALAQELRASWLLDRARALSKMIQTDPEAARRPGMFERLVVGLTGLSEAEALQSGVAFRNYNLEGFIARERTILWAGLNNFAFTTHDDLGNLLFAEQVVRSARLAVALRPDDRQIRALGERALALMETWHPSLRDPDRANGPGR